MKIQPDSPNRRTVRIRKSGGVYRTRPTNGGPSSIARARETRAEAKRAVFTTPVLVMYPNRTATCASCSRFSLQGCKRPRCLELGSGHQRLLHTIEAGTCPLERFTPDGEK